MSDWAIELSNVSKVYTASTPVRSIRRYITAYFNALRGDKEKLDQYHQHTSFHALRDLNHTFYEGTATALLGRNGAGKSTLLKIISYITEPTSGYARMKGKVASVLEVGAGFHRELTGVENIYMYGAIMGMSGAEIDRNFDNIVQFAGVEKFLYNPMKKYSSGMATRLAFSVVAHVNADILLIDEALAVSDIQFQKQCYALLRDMRNQGKTIVFVSHDLNNVQHICTHALYLQSGEVHSYGELGKILTQYQEDNHLVDESVQFGIFYEAPFEVVREQSNLRIIRVMLCDENDVPLQSLKCFSYTKIRVFFMAPEPLMNAECIIRLYTMEDLFIMGYSSRNENGALTFEEGENFIEALFPFWPYPDGQYRIRILLRDLTTGETCQVDDLQPIITYNNIHSDTAFCRQVIPFWTTSSLASGDSEMSED